MNRGHFQSVSAGEDLENALPSGSLPMGSMSSGSTLVGEVRPLIRSSLIISD